jgi:hypothetical protein
VQGTAGLFEQSEQSHRMSIRMHAQIDDCEGARVGIARLGSLLVQVGSIADGVSALTRATSLECPALLAAARRDLEGAVAQPGAACTDLPDAQSLGPSGKLAVFNALLGLREALRLDNRRAEAQRCVAAARHFAATDRTKLRLANAEADILLEENKAALATARFKRAIAQANAAGLPGTETVCRGLGLARICRRGSRRSHDYAAQSRPGERAQTWNG